MADLSFEDLYRNYTDPEHETFTQALDDTLHPLDWDVLFDLVSELGLSPDDHAVDVGCRDAYHSIELARRFRLRVHGVDPMPVHIDAAHRAIAQSDVADLVTADIGVGQHLPEADGTVALVWCRDVLVHVADLAGMFTEFRRVLRRDGHAVVFQMTATDWLEPMEAQRLWAGVAVVPESTNREHFEASIDQGGLDIVERVDLGSQWREASEEDGSVRTSRELLRMARLLRARDTFEQRFGAAAYQVMLSSCMWGVYQMIGKLSPQIYVLARS